MTNTRIGDVEIAETRFPLLLREFSIRRGSGGLGRNKGGDGVRREYEARVPMEVSDTTPGDWSTLASTDMTFRLPTLANVV
jgi:N-methylhydantoinase B/oxoprolinase/acetone carboxylase alpha subunit